MIDYTNPVVVCQELVRTGGYSGDEGPTAEVVKKIMAEQGYEEIDVMPCGAVIGLFGPKGTPVKVLFDSHMDVALITGSWTFDPYCGDIKDGKILGRGTTDMKAGMAASLCAVAQYAKSHKLEKRIAVSCSVIEETIEGLGVEEALEKYQPENVVICEPTEMAVMTGQKGRMELMLTLKGKAAHASNPEVGINSMLIAANALLALDKLVPPVHSILGAGILVPTDITTEPYPLISAVPEITKIRFDRRSLPGETEEMILEEISNVLKGIEITDFTVEVVKGSITAYTGVDYERSISLAPWSIERTSPLFLAMYEGAQAILEGQTVVSAWKCCTNGSESAKRNIPTIGMGPGSIAQAHTVDEFVAVEEVEKVTAIYVKFLENLL